MGITAAVWGERSRRSEYPIGRDNSDDYWASTLANVNATGRGATLPSE